MLLWMENGWSYVFHCIDLFYIIIIFLQDIDPMFHNTIHDSFQFNASNDLWYDFDFHENEHAFISIY